MAASFQDFFMPGWSTSKPGDMKNPSSIPTRFGSTKEVPKSTLAALDAAAAENQRKLHAEFMEMMKSKQSHAAVSSTSTGPLTHGKLLETIHSLKKLGIDTDTFNGGVMNADKLTVAGFDVAKREYDAKTDSIYVTDQYGVRRALDRNGNMMPGAANGTINSAPQEKPNNDRPQTEVDAW